MASFQGNIGWERPRKGENKTYYSVRSYLTRNREFQKSSKKIPNITKPRYGLFSYQNRLEKAKKERK